MPFALLAKDLTERAARKRTYVLRCGFGLLLGGWFWLFMHRYGLLADETVDPRSISFSFLGAGRELFQGLSFALCWAIIVLQPALMASAFTQEKERGTLELLLLTPMRVSSLLLQKYFAGLLSMANLLLFGLPLGAVAYSYGGISAEQLLGVGTVLLLAWLQAGAMALFCSAWFRTTPSALIASYVLLAAIFAAGNFDCFSFSSPSLLVGGAGWSYQREMSLNGTFPPSILRSVFLPRAPSLADPIYGSVLWLSASTVGFLTAVRFVLIRRSRVAPRRIGRRLLARLDEFFHRLNTVFGGAALAQRREETIIDQPIRWREYATGVLGRPQYLVRIGVALAILGTIGVLLGDLQGFLVLRGFIILCGVILLLRAVDVIGGERQRQTLEVLLSTPIPRRDLVRHKIGPLLWLSFTFLLPLGLLFTGVLFHHANSYWGGDGAVFEDYSDAVSICVALLCMAVLFYEFCWLGVLCGLVVPSRSKAVLIALGAALAWIFVPALTFYVTANVVGGEWRDGEMAWCTMLQPDGLITFAGEKVLRNLARQPGEATPGSVLGMVALVLLAHLAVAFVLRFFCLRRAERMDLGS